MHYSNLNRVEIVYRVNPKKVNTEDKNLTKLLDWRFKVSMITNIIHGRYDLGSEFDLFIRRWMHNFNCIIYFIDNVRFSHQLCLDGFIFEGTNFCGFVKIDTFAGFKIRGPGIFHYNWYRKLLFCGYWNSWIELSTKTTEIDTPRKLSHPQ